MKLIPAIRSDSTSACPIAEPCPGSKQISSGGRSHRSRLDQRRGAERGQLGRLEDHRIAEGDRGRGLPGRDHQRKVPGGDQADDAERDPQGEGALAARAEWESRTILQLGRLGEEAQDLRGALHLDAGLLDHLADLQRH